MEDKLLLNRLPLQLTIRRLAMELLERHPHGDAALLGMQPRGIFFARRIGESLRELGSQDWPLGALDITFYRDDFRRNKPLPEPSATQIPFPIDGRPVVLIDDVLFTGRTIRAALSALPDFGRPSAVELLVLIDRQYNRELPIAPDYVGRYVNSLPNQRVLVHWTEQNHPADSIWLVNAQNP